MADTGLSALNKETIAAVAADPTSDDLLNAMKQKAAELNSPWHKFQSDLDLMVAKSHYNPEAAVATVKQQRNLEDQQLQNIYANMSNIGMMRNQLANVNESYKQLQPQGGGGGTETDFSGLTPMQLNTLNGLRPYPEKFQEALKEFARDNAKTILESRLNKDNYTSVPGTISGYDKNGKFHNYEDTFYKYELEEFRNKGIIPSKYKGILVSKDEPIQKKAAGGSIQSMADGSQPNPVENTPIQNAPIAQDSGLQGTILDTILSTLMGKAEAAPQGTVTTQLGGPVIEQGPGSSRSTKGFETGLKKEEQLNQAQLKSLEQERDAAGKFISDLENQSFSATTLQNAQEIINMATKNPEYFGYAYKQDPVGLLMKLTGKTDESKGEAGERESGILSNLKEFFGGEDAMNKRSRLDNLARQLGIAYEKEQFGGTGSKMGAQLTSISQAAKGLGSKYPAEQNIAQAVTLQIVHERNSKIASEWDKYKKTVTNPDPYTFMFTPKIQALLNTYNLELTNRIDKIMNSPKEGSKDTDKSGNPIIFKDGKWMRESK
jgi:hypothetical protein